DNGLYIAGDNFIFYNETIDSARSIQPGEDFVFVLSQEASGETRGYVDGELQFTLGGGSNAASPDNILHILLDDNVTNGFETATGSIDYVRVYDAALSNDDVAALTPPQPDILGDTIFSTLTFLNNPNNFWVFETTAEPLAATVQAQGPEYSDPALGFYNLTVDIEQGQLSLVLEVLSTTSVTGAMLTLSDLDFETDLFEFALTSNTFPDAPSAVAVTAPDAVSLRLPTLQNPVPGTVYEMTFEFATARIADPDSDGVGRNVDNCLDVANPNQVDSDGDGFGNACDADLNNDCIVNAVDLGLLRVGFFGTPDAPNWNPDADFNNDGVVNAQDLGRLRAQFFGVPGPAAGANCAN
ncbi:MAG: LamG-like jellyroll fold domain-containing protein, partial [Gammaproteobacteria bacterium]